MTRVEKARTFAIAAHKAIGQRRKYSGACYSVHPAEVAELVAQSGGSEAMIAAAWLHDVVEDTNITQADISAMFDPEIAELVEWLTDVSKPEDGNRKLRKAMDLAHLAAAPRDAQWVKTCDLIANARDICANDPSFGRVFLREAKELLAAMEHVPADMRAQAEQVFTDCQEVLS